MSGVLSARTERLTRVYSDWHLKRTLTISSCVCLANSGSRNATLTSNRHLCLTTTSKENDFLAPPPPPLSRASQRHLRLDFETQTRDFYGIEVDLAERRAEKEKWRRILAERAEQQALGTGNAPFDSTLPANGENANLPSSEPTSSATLVTPPPPPAPAASMTLRDFNLEPRRARLMRKKAALGIPFDPDVTTLLKSGIGVRFDADNGPMDAYPDEPLMRQNLRLDSLVGALAPLASVDKALKSVGELNAGTSRGELNAGTSIGKVNAGTSSVAEDVERVGKRRRRRSNLEERGIAKHSLGSDVGNRSNLSSVSTVPLPIQLGADQSNLDLPPEGDSDMNLFDEQLMLAQFSIASPRHETDTEDSLNNFHRDLERISSEKMAREQNEVIEDDVKATLIEDANYFDQLYLEHSDFRGMKLNDVTEVKTQDEKDVAFAASSTKSDIFDDSSFDELNVFDQQMFGDESKLGDAASFVDMMEEVTSRSVGCRLPTESTPVLSFESETWSSSPEATSSSPSTRSTEGSTSTTCTMPTESASMPISSSKKSSPPTSSSPSLSDDLSRNLTLKPKFLYDPEEAPEPSRFVASLIRRRATWTFDTPVSGEGREAETVKGGPPLKTKTGSEGLVVEKKKRTLAKDELFMPPALRGEKRMDTKGFRKFKDTVADLKWASPAELTEVLHRRVIFNDAGIVAVDKPFGLPCQQGPNLNNTIDDILPLLADALGLKSLKSVHRLDQTTSGVLLFATNDKTMSKLKKYFAEKRVLKVYYALVKGQPQLNHGTIKIPLMDFKLKNGHRTMVAPRRDHTEEDSLAQGLLKDLIDKAELKRLAGKPKEAYNAITSYEVLDTNHGISLLEVQPQTGFKHQIRAHLAYGLQTPIVGDHKYSYTEELKPQRLPGQALQALKTRQALVRHIPLQLHAKSIVLPEFHSGRNVFVSANLPYHFKEMLRLLKLNIPKISGGTNV